MVLDPCAARTVLTRALRIVEDLYTDPLHDLLGEGGRQRRFVEWLVGVEGERWHEEAITLIRWHSIEGRDHTGQNAPRHFAQRCEGIRF